MNFNIVQIILFHYGIAGLKYEKLLELLGYCKGWGKNVKCAVFRQKLWENLIKLDTVFFYSPGKHSKDG